MSKLSDSIKNSMRDKALRLTKGDPTQKVDSSTWTPPEAENAGVKTGLRPLSKRQYKSGGKVHGANAKKRAESIAKASGNKIGRIRSARMGVFQITPVNSYDVSDWGMNDTSSLEKKVNAVVNVEFAISD